METGLSLLKNIKQEFACKEVDIRAYSPLTLAYIGDDVYDIVIRTVIVHTCNMPAHELHKRASRLVKAETQARIAEAMEEELSEAEEAVYKRGRNAKSYTTAKNASVNDPEKPSITSGLRLGTAAATTRGLKEDDMILIADAIAMTLKDPSGSMDKAAAIVKSVTDRYPLY